MGDLTKARELAAASGDRIRSNRDRGLEANQYETEGWIEILAGNDAAARLLLERSLAISREQHVRPLTTLVLFAVLEARAGRKETALEWIGLVRAQPSLNRGSVEWYLRYHMAEITEGLAPERIEAALAQGATRSLEDVLEQVAGRAGDGAAGTGATAASGVASGVASRGEG